MVLANVAGRSLTDPLFAPIWAEIDRRGLPVLVHPTDPPGVYLMDMTKFDLSWSVGFMFDTTLSELSETDGTFRIGHLSEPLVEPEIALPAHPRQA